MTEPLSGSSEPGAWEARRPIVPATGPRLGFGCSALVGGKTSKEARRLLDTAWDAGIRHFDTARMYGTGDAEGVLGSFAADKRPELTIATKFGIEPLALGPATAGAKLAARALLRRSDRLLSFARRHAGKVSARSSFEPTAARTSIETSLQALRTDYLDILFMHDCSAEHWLSEEARTALDALHDAGVVRHRGTATSFGETRRLVTMTTAFPEVIQFDSNVFHNNARATELRTAPSTRITYGPLSASLSRVLGIVADEDVRSAWESRLGISLRTGSEVAVLLLSHALWSNPSGLVLFSASDPERVRTNTQAASPTLLDDAGFLVFEQLLGGR